jgi:serine/threonine protein kinase
MNEALPIRIGPYRIRREETREITEQGPRLVYEAEERSGRTVALHLLPPVAQTEEARQFEQAVRAVGALTHPPRTHAHVQRIYDVSPLAETPDGPSRYVVTEHLNSPTLREHLNQTGKISLREASDFLTQIASAVDAIHAAGVVHGNIGFGTIRFDKCDRHIIKLVGFENARPIGTERTGRIADPEEDRRAVVGLLFEMVLGRPVAADETPVIPGASETVEELNQLASQSFSTALEFALAVRAALPVEATDTSRPAAPTAAMTAPTSFRERFKVLLGVGVASAVAVTFAGMNVVNRDGAAQSGSISLNASLSAPPILRASTASSPTLTMHPQTTRRAIGISRASRMDGPRGQSKVASFP